jgi:aerotaxis receptor
VLFGRLDNVLSAIAVVYALFFLFWVTPRVARDLSATADYLESVLTTGDLKTRLKINRRDLIGHVARLADRFIASVQATVQGMADSAKQVENANREVQAGVLEVNRSAIVQNDATSASAAAVEEVSVSIGEVAAHAGSTEAAAHKAGGGGAGGRGAVAPAGEPDHSLTGRDGQGVGTAGRVAGSTLRGDQPDSRGHQGGC